jgi:hypothetical protein
MQIADNLIGDHETSKSPEFWAGTSHRHSERVGRLSETPRTVFPRRRFAEDLVPSLNPVTAAISRRAKECFVCRPDLARLESSPGFATTSGDGAVQSAWDPRERIDHYDANHRKC